LLTLSKTSFKNVARDSGVDSKKYLGLFRAGLNIGKTGQMPGVLRFWGPRAWIPKTRLLVFHVFRLFTTH